MLHVVTNENYNEVVEKSSGLVLLDVWAPWCAPCKAIEPMVEEATTRAGIVLAKLNVEELPELASRIGIGGLPTIRLMRNGQTIFEAVGTVDRGRLDAALAAAV